MNLNHNKIKELGEFEGFDNLEQLSIDFNEISDISTLQQLANFKKLVNIRIKTNPISEKLGASYVRQRTIAEIPTLIEINGSEIKKFERKDCEIYYMKKTFQNFFDLKQCKHYEYDFEEFTKWCIGKH